VPPSRFQSIGSSQYWDMTYAAWRAFTPRPAIVYAGVAMIACSMGYKRAKMPSTCFVLASDLMWSEHPLANSPKRATAN
jgi:hypothetical protein